MAAAYSLLAAPTQTCQRCLMIFDMESRGGHYYSLLLNLIRFIVCVHTKK